MKSKNLIWLILSIFFIFNLGIVSAQTNCIDVYEPCGWNSCSEGCPCEHGQGDCDSDLECENGLTCVSDVGIDYGCTQYVDICVGSSRGCVRNSDCMDCSLDAIGYDTPICCNGECICGGHEVCDGRDNDCNGIVDEGCAVCGNGIVESREECDEGSNNQVPCSAPYDGQCTYCNDCKNVIVDGPYCGDGLVNGPEQCDDGNNDPTDQCANDCTLTYCSDGTVQNPNGYGIIERCDDGNLINGDGCDLHCLTETQCPPFGQQQCGWSLCSVGCLCSEGEGDCDNDEDCMQGLTCVPDIGAGYGCKYSVDICIKKCPDYGLGCADYYEPVCGVDGQTYSNDCVAGSNCVDIACKGECPCQSCNTEADENCDGCLRNIEVINYIYKWGTSISSTDLLDVLLAWKNKDGC